MVFRWVIALSAATLGVASHTTGLAQAQEPRAIIPHNAVYTLSLLEASVGEVSSIDGGLEIQMVRTCEDFTSELDMVISASSGGSRIFEMISRTTYRERLDGTRFEFESENLLNGEDVGSSAGVATLTPGRGGVVNYTHPMERTLPLPPSTEFPYISVTDMVQDFWVEGKRIRTYFYFDGNVDGVLRATDLVAGSPAPIPDGLDDPDGLLTTTPLRIVTTFFPPEEGDNTPQGTLIADIQENGVLTRMTIEVGFMTIVAHLTKVTANELPGC